MHRIAAKTIALSLALASTAAAHVPKAVQGGSSGSGTIKNVIVIVQENRTVDNLFQGLPGANTASSIVNSQGVSVPLVAQPGGIALPYDLGHKHSHYVLECNTSYEDIAGNPTGGDTVTTTINGHAVVTNVMPGWDPPRIATQIANDVNADGTDSAIVIAQASSNGLKNRVVFYATAGYTNVYSLAASAAGGTTIDYAAPQIGGACPSNTGFDREKKTSSCSTNPFCPPNSTAAFVYVPSSYTGPYWAIANEGAFADENFEPNQSPSTPAHMYMLHGTSRTSLSVDWYVSENPENGESGCEWNGSTINQRGLVGYPFTENSLADINPICISVPPITAQLEAQGLSWKEYIPVRNGSGAYGYWDGAAQDFNICGTVVANTCTGADYNAHVFAPETTILSDISAHQLAAVSWVIPNVLNSDHPGSTGNGGPNWVASIVNAVGGSSYWANCAILIYWDDWGGFADHVAPPIVQNDGAGSPYVPFTGTLLSPNHYGYRVPLMAISPYIANPGTVDHTVRDSTSILHFIETQILKSSSPISSVSIERAHDDLSPMFNLLRAPLTFTPIPLNSGM